MKLAAAVSGAIAPKLADHFAAADPVIGPSCVNVQLGAARDTAVGAPVLLHAT